MVIIQNETVRRLRREAYASISVEDKDKLLKGLRERARKMRENPEYMHKLYMKRVEKAKDLEYVRKVYMRRLEKEKDPEYIKKRNNRVRLWVHNKPATEDQIFYGFRRTFVMAEKEYKKQNPNKMGRTLKKSRFPRSETTRYIQQKEGLKK